MLLPHKISSRMRWKLTFEANVWSILPWNDNAISLSFFYILSLFWFRVMTLTWALQVMCLQRSQRTRNCWHCPVSQKNRSTNSQMVCRISLFIPKITEIILLLLKLTTIGRIFNACDISQRPRIDLNKRCLPRPNTTTAWKLIP